MSLDSNLGPASGNCNGGGITMQNWAVHGFTRTGARVAWGRWRVASNLRISIKRLTSFVLCVPALAFLPPVTQGRQSLSRADWQTESGLQTQTQQASPSAADQQNPPDYTISVESNLVILDV